MMNSKIYIIALAMVLVVLGILGFASFTKGESIQAAGPEPTPPAQPDNLRILQDKELRARDWKLVVETIEREKSNAGQQDFEPPSQEMIKAMVELLDWERPKSSGGRVTELDGVKVDVLEDSPSSRTYFPAISALNAWKDHAIPAVVEVIENSDQNSVKWKNAFTVIRAKFENDDLAVSNFLVVRAADSQTEAGKKSLLKASKFALDEKKRFEAAALRDSQKP